jgi:hypothetical protein
MQRYVDNKTWRLGVSEDDLYTPILTFVFGEAQISGSSAIVSCHRLTQEFYGLAPDLDLLANRLLIESVHERSHFSPHPLRRLPLRHSPFPHGRVDRHKRQWILRRLPGESDAGRVRFLARRCQG